MAVASDRHFLVAAYIAEQVFQVVVGGALALVLRELLHVAVETEVEPGQLLLHLAHVLQLFEGAHLTWMAERSNEGTGSLQGQVFLWHPKCENSVIGDLIRNPERRNSNAI